MLWLQATACDSHPKSGFRQKSTELESSGEGLAPLALTKQVCLGSVPLGGCARGPGGGWWWPQDWGWWPRDWLHPPPRLVPRMGMAISCQVIATATSLWCRDRSPLLAEPGDGFLGAREGLGCPRAFLSLLSPQASPPQWAVTIYGQKNGATVLKHAASWGFIGGVAASANGLNNLAVTSGGKNTTALFHGKYLKLVFARCLIVMEMESPELKLVAASAQSSPPSWP